MDDHTSTILPSFLSNISGIEVHIKHAIKYSIRQSFAYVVSFVVIETTVEVGSADVLV